MSRYPFSPYPGGWFQVGFSGELAAGAVRPLSCFGQELVLFRTEAGEAVVLDAHCPHLGAHLGHGGCVRGESIVCPFHNWRFDAQGRLVEIPYARRARRPDASLRRWPVHETCGVILVWNSPSGAEPGWRMPDAPEYGAAGWSGYHTRSWRVRMHVQELAENVPDAPHFRYVHRTPTLPTAVPSTDGPIYRQETRMTSADGTVDLTFRQEAFGLGLIWLRTASEPRMAFLNATTPLDDEHCQLTLAVLIRDPEPGGELSPAGRAHVEALFAQVDQDVPIFENKVYRPKPPLVEDDGPIPVLRRWAQQFYA
jgi:phenylpropionate dioxygenase-like ring-hydroxylating dioxygenase large terminal subunit